MCQMLGCVPPDISCIHMRRRHTCKIDVIYINPEIISGVADTLEKSIKFDTVVPQNRILSYRRLSSFKGQGNCQVKAKN